jgi:hypothetical protein
MLPRFKVFAAVFEAAARVCGSICCIGFPKKIGF